MDKSIIVKRFSSALKTYDENAIIQNRMAGNLLKLIKMPVFFNQIFEIGCGTGLLTKKIIYNVDFNRLIANDIVDCRDYVCVDERISFLQGDIESIEIPSGNDLVISNATFQWINDYGLLFKKIFNSLNNNGILAFSTFGVNNFIELRRMGFPSLRYYSISEITDFFNNYFETVSVIEEEIRLTFNSFKDLFYHIKNTGVNAVKYNYNIFPVFYKYYKVNENVQITYHPVYFVLRRKA